MRTSVPPPKKPEPKQLRNYLFAMLGAAYVFVIPFSILLGPDILFVIQILTIYGFIQLDINLKKASSSMALQIQSFGAAYKAMWLSLLWPFISNDVKSRVKDYRSQFEKDSD